MDTNEREGESDPIGVFIRVYSCPFAVEIAPIRPAPAPPQSCLGPPTQKIGKPRMDTNEREGEEDPIGVFIRVYSCPFAVEIAPIDLPPPRHNPA